MYTIDTESASSSFTRIPNAALAWLYGPECPLTHRQRTLMLVVFRFTYGFSRTSAALSSRFLETQTGIDRANCTKDMRAIVEAGLLTVSTTRRIGLYGLCSRRYKNKQNHSAECSDGVDLTPRGQNNPDLEVDLTPKIERNKPPYPLTSEKNLHSGRLSNSYPSALEQRFAALLIENGLPFCEREYPLGQWRFDFAWPSEKVLVEIHGGTRAGYSHSTAEGMAKDHQKANYATSRGWLLLTLTDAMFDDRKALEAVFDALREKAVSGTHTLPPELITGPVFDPPEDAFDGLF